VVVIRERGGSTLPAVFKSESAALGWITSHVAKGTKVVADEAPSWNDLHAKYEVARIDHQQAYSLNGVYSNGAESFFSRMRREEIGHHHHVAGPYLVRYAQESAWREDKRACPTGIRCKWRYRWRWHPDRRRISAAIGSGTRWREADRRFVTLKGNT